MAPKLMRKKKQSSPIQVKMKMIVVGDGGVGKTSLLSTFTNDYFPEEYTPTVFDHFEAFVLFRKKAITLLLWDSAGQEELDALRVLSYPDTDLFLVCFSLVNPVSLDNVMQKWLPELREHAPCSKFIIVGTQSDVRDHMKKEGIREQRSEGILHKPIPTCMGEKLAREVHAVGYCECSALTRQGLKHLFDVGVKANFSKNSKECTIM